MNLQCLSTGSSTVAPSTASSSVSRSRKSQMHARCTGSANTSFAVASPSCIPQNRRTMIPGFSGTFRRFHSRHNGRALKRKDRAMCGPSRPRPRVRKMRRPFQERRILIDLELPVIAACQLGHTGPDQWLEARLELGAKAVGGGLLVRDPRPKSAAHPLDEHRVP